MEEFGQLIDILNALHGPRGCPWDKKQTFQTLRSYILEEVHELLDSVDENDVEGMVEELGDLFFQILFFAKLGEKSGFFNLKDVIKGVSKKLIRRHPHVFGDLKAETPEEVIDHWERVKQEEKKERKTSFREIPKTLNGLARAQKIISKLHRKKIAFPEKREEESLEFSIGEQLLDVVIRAHREGLDAESALRTILKRFEALLG